MIRLHYFFDPLCGWCYGIAPLIKAAAALSDVTLWFTLLDLYETDLLPIAKNFSPRALSVRVRRWREPVEVAEILFRRIFLRQRFSVSRIYPAESI